MFKWSSFLFFLEHLCSCFSTAGVAFRARELDAFVLLDCALRTSKAALMKRKLGSRFLA